MKRKGMNEKIYDLSSDKGKWKSNSVSKPEIKFKKGNGSCKCIYSIKKYMKSIYKYRWNGLEFNGLLLPMFELGVYIDS